MKKIKTKLLFVSALLFLSSFSVFAQAEISLGTDLVSRYVWRGTDFGQSPSIQPTLALTVGGLEFGAWGAYQLGRDAISLPADELDLYLGYSLALGSTTLDLLVTDYYFPTAGLKFGDFSDEGGAHIIEVGATISGPESLPLYLSAYVNVYNDTDNSAYIEVGYSTAVNDVSLDVFVGATPGGDNMYYGTKDLNVINMGITASKEIKITEDFSLPIFGSYMINPNQEISYFVLGISL